MKHADLAYIVEARHLQPLRKGWSLDEFLAAVERQAIVGALQETKWNRTRAAESLGLTFGALRHRMTKLDL